MHLHMLALLAHLPSTAVTVYKWLSTTFEAAELNMLAMLLFLWLANAEQPHAHHH